LSDTRDDRPEADFKRPIRKLGKFEPGRLGPPVRASQNACELFLRIERMAQSSLRRYRGAGRYDTAPQRKQNAKIASNETRLKKFLLNWFRADQAFAAPTSLSRRMW
jgi:hypothetical protein